MMELIFVYNANSGRANKMWDAVHKMVSPTTYDCELCTLTHHSFGAHSKWQSFLKEAKVSVKVYYKDQFERTFDSKMEFPAVLFYENSVVRTILDKKELKHINELEDLLVLLEQKLSETTIE